MEAELEVCLDYGEVNDEVNDDFNGDLTRVLCATLLRKRCPIVQPSHVWL